AVERRRQAEELLLVVEFQAEDFTGIRVIGGLQDELAELTTLEYLVLQLREAGEDRLVDILVEDTGSQYPAGLEVPLERKVQVHRFERLQVRVSLLRLALEDVRVVFLDLEDAEGYI